MLSKPSISKQLFFFLTGNVQSAQLTCSLGARAVDSVQVSMTALLDQLPPVHPYVDGTDSNAHAADSGSLLQSAWHAAVEDAVSNGLTWKSNAEVSSKHLAQYPFTVVARVSVGSYNSVVCSS
jgi:hypothetical protein